ncbi:MBL fold metallo-hydrolase [Lentibacillus sediminis]|uniref:MBL fold metallo-hydrolase n=1 Tax=Lentibacillus sediminis TaxID=1940529 RepID=UPI000C1C52DE|nr:MBL fold metallo-hydrolase [Lentibacillus sediminis]
MLEKITEKVHKLTIPYSVQEVNSYFVEGKKGYTIIDTGIYSEEAIELWKNILRDIQVEKVVLTHTHQDHIGLAAWFQQEIGVPVFVSNLGYQEMQTHRETDIPERIKQLLTKHGGQDLPERTRDDSFIYAFEPDGFFNASQEMQLGDDFYQVIWTPGHAPDHFCFYQPNTQEMFIGDHLLKDISPVIGLWDGIEANPLEDYYRSLERMQNYPAEVALPGHGAPIYHLAGRAKDTKIKHDARLEQVLNFVKSEGKTAYQVCQEIYGELHPPLYISQLMAALTRLIYLESLGKIERSVRDGVVEFRVV